jgi:hypothetical protein
MRMDSIESQIAEIKLAINSHAKAGAEQAGTMLGFELMFYALIDTHPDKKALARSLAERAKELFEAAKKDQKPGPVLFRAEEQVEKFQAFIRVADR